MASPTYDDVWAYSRQVQGISQKARDAFLAAAQNVDYSDWAAAADQLRDIIYAIVDTYGLAAGELGAQWYEYCHGLKYDRGYTAIVGKPSRYSVKSDADAVIDKLFSGETGTEAMVASLAGVVVNQVQKSSRDVILDNLDAEYKAAIAARDYGKARGMGYCRVPHGDACAFCIMLASRGFVYASEETATTSKRTGGKYHEHCTCTAVPFAEAGSIRGYGRTLAGYEDRYLDARALWKSKDRPEELDERIAKAKAEHAEKMRQGLAWDKWGDDNEITITMRYMDPSLH